MRSLVFLATVSLILGAGLMPRSCSAQGAAGFEKFGLAEYPAALARLEQSFGDLDFQGSSTLRGSTYSIDGDGAIDELRSDLREVGFARRDRETAKVFGARGVASMNPDYAFLLERERPRSPYTVRDVGDRALVERALHLDVEKYLGASFRFNAYAISRVIVHKSFEVVGVSRGDGDDPGATIRIDFTFEPDRANQLLLKSGWFELDPARAWAVRRYEIGLDGAGDNRLVGEIEYGETLGGVPMPDRVTVWHGPKRTERDGKDLYSQEEYEVHSIARGPRDGNAFRLTSYGLPEVGVPAP